MAVGCAKGGSSDPPPALDTSSKAASEQAALGASEARVLEAAPGGSPRSKLKCSELIPKAEEASKAVNMEMEIKPGSWGGVPPELQKLPSGAELCGSVGLMNQAVIASGLTRQDLEAFYAPLFASLGCQPFKCEDETRGSEVQTSCTCRGNGNFGTVVTDVSVESYALGFITPGFGSKE